ncbi:efflux RND transporter permease subunit [Rhodovibrionaceae bacterium A322]
MNLIRASIERPIAVIAAVFMVIMFGLVALQSIPIQLTPDVNRPVISVTTVWGTAAPAEIEREITNRQEEVLKGLEGLVTMTSSSQTGRARITLEFEVGTNMDRSLLLTANRLDRVSGYPDEADEPTLDTSGSDDDPIAWFQLIRAEGNDRPIYEYGDYVKDVIAPKLERVKGVAAVNFYGGSERQIEVVVEPALMARYGLTVSDLVSALRQANVSASAGDVDEGKRRYVVRTEGELQSLSEVRDIVVRSLRSADGRLARVTVKEIADVRWGYRKPTSLIRQNGNPALALNTVRETGANVIETMEGIRAAVKDLSDNELARQGLILKQVYDETVYIDSSIELVNQNIYVGGSLAAIILLLFLRSGRATLVVSLAIPVSVIGAFVAMAALGRSINVISLAGLAFAIGMVVDAAIVVLENIFRHREAGHSAMEAAYKGASEVWGAVLVSSLTTVMVFIPILVMDLEVGQLFRDIAVAISVSVLLSLLVAVTVIPALASRLLKKGDGNDSVTRLRLPVIDDIADRMMAFLMKFQGWIIAKPLRSLGLVAGVSVLAVVGSWAALPKLEYLPDGNRNLLIGFLLPPPGYNLDTTVGIAKEIEANLLPRIVAEDSTETMGPNGPLIERFFFVAFRANTILGIIAKDPSKVKEMKKVIQEAIPDEPGTFASVRQRSLFGRNAGSRQIDLEISGNTLEDIIPVAQQAMGQLVRAFPPHEGNQFRPKPGLELGSPEVRVIPNRLALADAGVSARELADTVQAFNDGVRVAEVTVGTKRVDLRVMGPVDQVDEIQGIGALPVVTRDGQILPVTSLASVEFTAGPTELFHSERRRTIKLLLWPRDDIPLEAAVDKLNSEVIQPMVEGGLPAGIQLNLSGTADKLSQTWEAMVLDLVLALVIVYLVMAVLFESFLYPLIILLSVPLAAAGGVAGLWLVNLQVNQPLDMLTLLGFVILIGIVVNNAILLVHQTLHHLRIDKMEATAAILEATRNRVRPIYMSTATSVFGMLPLVIIPGAGSELYRGLGSVVVGGLALSAILTLLIVPPMLSLVVLPLEAREKRRKISLSPISAIPDGKDTADDMADDRGDEGETKGDEEVSDKPGKPRDAAAE